MKQTTIIESPGDNHDKILSLFDSPKLIGVIGDANSGKSNLLYFIIKTLRAKHTFSLFTYGMRVNIVGEQKIYSVERLETIRNSVIIIDEFASLFDMDDRKEKKQIEHTLRLIFHNNNVVLFCGLPENYKKFIAAKLDSMIFKKCAMSDFINGSRTKKVAFNCEVDEKGSAVFAIPTDQAIVYDGLDYHKVRVPYQPDADTKANNEEILK